MNSPVGELATATSRVITQNLGVAISGAVFRRGRGPEHTVESKSRSSL